MEDKLKELEQKITVLNDELEDYKKRMVARDFAFIQVLKLSKDQQKEFITLQDSEYRALIK